MPAVANVYDMFACAAAVKLNINGLLSPVTLVAFHTQLFGGEPVDVSLNTIVNGRIPSQPRDVLLVTDEMFLEENDATGAELTFTHVTWVEMFVPSEFVAFSLMV